MSRLRTHFERRAAELQHCATLEVEERWHGDVFMRLRPHHGRAVGVTLYLGPAELGTVTFDDQASVPAELGDSHEDDVRAIDSFIKVAVEGRVMAYHKGTRGGCVEERDRDGRASRSWMNVWFALPGWRRRWPKVEYEPYR